MEIAKQRPFKFKLWSLVSKEMSPAMEIRTLLNIVATKPVVGLQHVVFNQYTGLKDVFGKEVYENDICEQVIGGKVYTGVMIFSSDRLCFGMESMRAKEDDMPDYVELKLSHNSTEGLPKVIGNIFENPELAPNELKKHARENN